MVRSVLVPPEAAVQQKYLQLVAEIDKEIKRISSSYDAGFLQCRPGCYECCINFSVFPLEAALLHQQLEVESTSVKSKEEFCSLLKDERCSIYDVRPIICRTQGIPLGYVDVESGMVEVSACNLNFVEDYRFKDDEILYMDQFNSRLSELNHQYCRSMDLDPYKRIPLSSLIK